MNQAPDGQTAPDSQETVRDLIRQELEAQRERDWIQFGREYLVESRAYLHELRSLNAEWTRLITRIAAGTETSKWLTALVALFTLVNVYVFVTSVVHH